MCHHVAVFAVDVEQVGFVRAGVTIADALAHHHGAKAVLHRVHRAGADAAALVEQPIISSVSIPCATSSGASAVPKKALAYCLLSTTSSASGATGGQNAASGLPATMSFITGAF